MPQRSGERETGWQLPSSLDDLIPTDHAVRFVAAYLDSLDATDWRSLGISLQAAERGAPRYHPVILLGLWVWGFMQGVRSARKLEVAAQEMLSYRWLSGQQTPDHNTLWRFYQAHRAGMRYLLTHSVQVAVRTGMVDLALQAVDGTKMAGNAAKDRTYDAAGLDRLIERTEQAIADLEAQNATGGEEAPPRLPQDLASRQALLQRVREVRAHLEPGSRINLTDPEAQLMRSRGGYVAGYNGQIVVAPLAAEMTGCGGMLITAAAVTDEADDHRQLVPMLEQAAQQTGSRAAITLADGGYHSAETLLATADHLVLMPEAQPVADPYHKARFHYAPQQDIFTCPQGQTLHFAGVIQRTDRSQARRYRSTGAVCRACPAMGRCTTDRRQGRSLEVGPLEELLVAHRALMATEEAQRVYAQRKEVVEPVFGIQKEQQGARRFLLRGRTAVDAEWRLLAATFNLRVLARLWRTQPALRTLVAPSS
jgi:transposase